ncbi:MAG: hypothetical protein RL698_1965 [Pseudomonadota bacterium]|jgi:hypothetical protein
MHGPHGIAGGSLRLGSAVAALVALAAGAALAGEQVQVQVGTVYATNASEHFDADLEAMRSQLSRLFRYTSYRLVKKESRDVGWGDPVDVELPGGRFLRVMPKSAGGERVSLDVMLRKNQHVLMDTEFTVRPHGTVMVGGPKHEDGVLIIWIGAHRLGGPGVRPQAVR